MDPAHSGLEGSTDPVYHPVRRPDEQPLTQTPFTQNSGHALPARAWVYARAPFLSDDDITEAVRAIFQDNSPISEHGNL